MNFTSFFLKKVSYQLVEQVLRVIVNLAVFYFVSKTLDYERLAVFNVTLMVVGLLGAFQTFGLTNTVLIDLRTSVHSKNIIISNAFILSLFGNILIILFGSLILLFLSDPLFLYLGIVILFCFSFKFNDLIKSFYIAFEWHKSNSLIEMANIIVFGIIKIYFLTQANFYAFILTVASENLSIFLISAIFFYNKGIRFTKIDIDAIKYLFKGSRVFFISSLIIGAYSKLDQLILANWIDSKEISEFYVGIKFNDSAIMLIGVVISSIYPMLYDMYKKGVKEFLTTIKHYFKWFYLLFIVYFILNATFSRSIFNLLFDEKFEFAYLISIIHSPVLLFSFLGTISDKYSAMTGDKTFIYNKYLITLLISITLNLILTPLLGVNGYILSLMIANIYQGILSDFVSINRRDLFYAKILIWRH